MKKILFLLFVISNQYIYAQWEQENIFIQSGSISNFHFINSDTAFATSSPYSNYSTSFIYKRYYEVNSWKWEIIDTVHSGITGFQYLNDSLVFYASGNCCLYKSVDGLNTWNLTGTVVYDEFQDLYFFNKDTGIIVGKYINITNDAGQSWTRYNSPIHYTKGKLHIVNNSVGYAIIGGVYKIMNKGDSVIQLTNNYISDYNDINEIYFVDENHGYILGDKGFISETFDGGDTWNLDSISDYDLNTMYFLNDTIGFLGADEGNSPWSNFLFFTTDGGQTWGKTYAPVSVSKIYAVDTTTLFIGGRVSIIYKLDSPLNYLTTNIETHISYYDVKVYPNPTNDFVNIEFPHSINRKYNLSLYSLDGKLIKEIELNDSYKLDLSDIKSGVYICQIQSDNQIKTVKILKQ